MSDTSSPRLSGLEEQAARLFRLGEEGRVWYVFHTRPRCEKKVAAACLDMEIRHYLPLRKSRPRKRKGQRNYSFDIPLFPGYLFGCCDLQERYDVMRTNHLVRTIDVLDQQQLLEELHSIYLASGGEADLTLYPQLKRGRRVRVIRGVLKGVSGRISTRKDEFRLVLNVSILGTAVAAEIDVDDVELIQH